MTGLAIHTNPATQKHTGKLDVHGQEAVCLMPVFFCQVCRAEEVGGGAEGKMRMGGWEKGKTQAEDESRHRESPIKNDSHRRTRQGMDRKKRDYVGREERQRILIGEMEGSKPAKKSEQSIIEAGREGEIGSQGRGRQRRWYSYAPLSLASRYAGRKRAVRRKTMQGW